MKMWFMVGFALAFVALSMIPTSESKPPGVDQFQGPTAEIGREIPVLFGKRNIPGANVVWHGDLKLKPIRSGGGKKG